MATQYRPKNINRNINPGCAAMRVDSQAAQIAERNGVEKLFGAEEGTRTPTPLRVHGPEPCASANSATSASDLMRGGRSRLEGRDYDVYSYKARTECQTLPETLPRSMPPLTDQSGGIRSRDWSQ